MQGHLSTTIHYYCTLIIQLKSQTVSVHDCIYICIYKWNLPKNQSEYSHRVAIATQQIVIFLCSGRNEDWWRANTTCQVYSRGGLQWIYWNWPWTVQYIKTTDWSVTSIWRPWPKCEITSHLDCKTRALSAGYLLNQWLDWGRTGYRIRNIWKEFGDLDIFFMT